MSLFRTLLAVSCIALVCIAPADAQRRVRGGNALGLGETFRTLSAPAGMRMLTGVVYGRDPLQRFDVYLPEGARDAPIVLMVHGGGWARGDKDAPGVVDNKVAHWLPKGAVLVSVNNRLLPEASPLGQAHDVARALARVQALAPEWNADPRRVLLMGHSAGAHLVALVGADPSLVAAAGASPPVGVVALDSAAMDVPAMMAMPRLPPLYARAFGDDRADWLAASPLHRMRAGAPPILAVCSSRRADACPQARALATHGRTLGVRVDVLPQPLSHKGINHALGLAGDYTAAVDRFVDPLLFR